MLNEFCFDVFCLTGTILWYILCINYGYSVQKSRFYSLGFRDLTGRKPLFKHVPSHILENFISYIISTNAFVLRNSQIDDIFSLISSYLLRLFKIINYITSRLTRIAKHQLDLFLIVKTFEKKANILDRGWAQRFLRTIFRG